MYSAIDITCKSAKTGIRLLMPVLLSDLIKCIYKYALSYFFIKIKLKFKIIFGEMHFCGSFFIN